MIEKFCQSVVYPIPPAFNSDQGADYASVAAYIEYLHDNGARVFLTTAGTSRFNLLDNDEIMQLNWVCQNTVRRLGGVFIMGIPPLANCHLDQFRKMIEKSQPDAVLAMYPDRYYNDEAIVSYFRSMAGSMMVPVMVHGMPMRNATGGIYNFTPDLIKKLKDLHRVIGMKEESAEYNQAYLTSKLADDGFFVFPAGGSGRRFLLTHPAGAQNYLAGVGSIFPKIEEAFYNCMKAGETTTASHIIRNFEDPLMECFGKIGWHLALQIALDKLGVLRTYNRQPFAQASEDQVRAVVDVLNQLQQKWIEE